MNSTSNRISWLDYARTFAILCVIVVHSTESIYPINADTMAMLPFVKKIIVISLFTFGRLGVPVFLFLTGYLLLDRPYDEKGIQRFYRHNFVPLLLTTELWIIIYEAFISWYTNTPVDVWAALKDLLFLKQCNLSHMWYMPMIIGMYLGIPLMSNAVKTCNLRYLELLIGIAFIVLFCPPVLNTFLYAEGKESINFCLDFSWTGGIYGIMMLSGYCVKKGVFAAVKTPFVVLVGMFSFIVTVYAQYFSNVRNIDCGVWYNSGSLILCSFSVFLLIKRWNPKERKLVAQISIFSFGIYLIHNPVLMILLKYMPMAESVKKIIVLMFFTFILTYGIIYTLSKFKVFRHLLMIKS